MRSEAVAVHSAPIVLDTSAAGEPPDIYYIILDTYTRQDVYRRVLAFDNSEFITALRERGFTVNDCSLSNYNSTSASMISALDMQYLDELTRRLAPGTAT